jgi:hypothetical protein
LEEGEEMKHWSVLSALCLLALCGCSTISFERKVEDNTFFSFSDPRVQVHVTPGFRYIGEVVMARRHQNVRGARNLLVNNSSYVFAQIGRDGTLAKGAVIRVDRVKKSGWQSDLFADIKNKLVADYENIGFDRYEHFIAVRSDIFTTDEMNFVISEGLKSPGAAVQGGHPGRIGYRIPKCFLVEAFGMRAGAGNDTKFCLYYFEDLAGIDERFSCREWIRGEMPAIEREAALRRFIESRKRNISITKHKK